MSSKRKRIKQKQIAQRAKVNSVDKQARLAELTKMLDFKKSLNSLFLSDLKKDSTVKYTQYTKDKYRNYMRNPLANIKNLRGMSHFLYNVSMPYRRLIHYFASIPLFYWNLIPQLDPLNPPNNIDKLLKNYNKLLKKIENLNLANEGRQIMATVFKDGVYFGFKYEDKNACFFHKLDPDYCRIAEIQAGCFNFAFNFEFFNDHGILLDYMHPTFKEMYEIYQNDKRNNKWQMLPAEDTICIKWDSDTLDITPPFVGIFESLLDLIDYRSLKRAKDEIENYKLIYQKLPYFDNTRELDDFKLEMDTAQAFYNALAEAVPKEVGVAMSPMDIGSVDFPTKDNENDILAGSMKAVFNDSGVSQLLFSDIKTGSTGLNASIKTDIAFAWGVVEHIENWIRRYIQFNKIGSQEYMFEMLHCDIFNNDKIVEGELKLANSGVPNKIKLAATSGINPYRLMSGQYFENEILKIPENWKPLQTSYTMSGNTEVDDNVADSTEKNRDLGTGKGGENSGTEE